MPIKYFNFYIFPVANIAKQCPGINFYYSRKDLNNDPISNLFQHPSCQCNIRFRDNSWHTKILWHPLLSGVFPKGSAYLSRCLASIHPTIAKNIYETENLSDQKLLHIDCRSTNEIKINIFFGQQREGLIEINSDTVIFSMLSSLIDSAISKFQHQIPVNGSVNRELLYEDYTD